MEAQTVRGRLLCCGQWLETSTLKTLSLSLKQRKTGVGRAGVSAGSWRKQHATCDDRGKHLNGTRQGGLPSGGGAPAEPWRRTWIFQRDAWSPDIDRKWPCVSSRSIIKSSRVNFCCLQGGKEEEERETEDKEGRRAEQRERRIMCSGELATSSQHAFSHLPPHSQEAEPTFDTFPLGTECSSPSSCIWSGQFCSVVSVVSSTMQKNDTLVGRREVNFWLEIQRAAQALLEFLFFTQHGTLVHQFSFCSFLTLKAATYANLSYKWKQRCNILGFSKVISKAVFFKWVYKTEPISTAILLSFLDLACHQNPAPEASSHVSTWWQSTKWKHK